MRWFAGIDMPLTAVERGELLQLELKCRAGAEVSLFPGLDRYSKLRARYDRAADLRQFQAANEAALFGEWLVVEQDGQLLVGGVGSRPSPWLSQRNLPALLRTYEQMKANWRRADVRADIRADIRLHLDEVAREEAARIAYARNPANHGDDPDKAEVFTSLVRRFFRKYRQHIEADLEEVGPAATQPAPTGDIPAGSGQLSLPQLALYYIYSGQHIHDRAHANELAETIGMRSGERLKKKYDSWFTTINRVNIEGGAKLRPFIKNIRAVIPLLAADCRERAERELRVLEEKLRTSLD